MEKESREMGERQEKEQLGERGDLGDKKVKCSIKSIFFSARLAFYSEKQCGNVFLTWVPPVEKRFLAALLHKLRDE